tara:strand:- start:6451 stop:7284 length:834 start_codon:yes stop_codon:yes gene_type:complete
MTVAEKIEEQEANPYNMKKDWHDGIEDKKFDSADGLFFEPKTKKATSSNEAEAPEEKEVNYKKRYDDLKKHYDNKVSEFKQREEELVAEVKSNFPAYEAPKTVEEIEAFRKKNPDLYDTVETVAHLQNEQQLADIRQELVSLKQRESDIAKKEAEVELRQRHPDFEDIRGDERFHEWAKEQPEQIQNWVYNNPNNASLASKAIDLFKLELGISTKSTKRKSASKGSAADMVSTKTKTIDTKQPKIWTEREIAQMSVADFDKYENEIDQAISEGRVVK